MTEKERKDKKSEAARKHRLANLEKFRAYDRARSNTPDRKAKSRLAVRKHNLKRIYGLTLAEFDARMASQDGRCGICGYRFSGTKDAHIDHDHEVGSVRGILCFRCNVGIGHFKDNVELLVAAIAYLCKASP